MITSLEDIVSPDKHAAFVKRMMTLAMDKTNKDKENPSVLVSEFYTEVIR